MTWEYVFPMMLSPLTFTMRSPVGRRNRKRTRSNSSVILKIRFYLDPSLEMLLKILLFKCIYASVTFQQFTFLFLLFTALFKRLRRFYFSKEWNIFIQHECSEFRDCNSIHYVTKRSISNKGCSLYKQTLY